MLFIERNSSFRRRRNIVAQTNEYFYHIDHMAADGFRKVCAAFGRMFFKVVHDLIHRVRRFFKVFELYLTFGGLNKLDLPSKWNPTTTP